MRNQHLKKFRSHGLSRLSASHLAESKVVPADSGSPRRLALLAILRPGIARVSFCLQVPSANAGVLVTPAPQQQRKLRAIAF
jgi:hypothetical protein